MVLCECSPKPATGTLLSPVDGRLADERVIQNASWNKLVADAVLEGTVDLWATSVRMEELKHLHLSLPVHVELRQPAEESHEDAAVVLQGPHEAADQLIGQPFCERLEGRNR